MNTKSLNKTIINHFSLNLSDEVFKVIYFGKENFKENKLIVTETKNVLFLDNNIKTKFKHTSLEEVTKVFLDKAMDVSLYYFIDKMVKVKKHISNKYSFNLVSEKELDDFFINNSFGDDIYISSSDIDVLGIYKDSELIGVVSLIKFDDFYDLCVCVKNGYQNKHVGRVLLYEYLKYEKKNRTIRIMVNSKNIQMVKVLESLGLKSQAMIIETKSEDLVNV